MPDSSGNLNAAGGKREELPGAANPARGAVLFLPAALEGNPLMPGQGEP